jgi:hypothetical protein
MDGCMDWTGLHKPDHQERERERERTREMKNAKDEERERETERERKKEGEESRPCIARCPCAIRINTPWFKERE